MATTSTSRPGRALCRLEEIADGQARGFALGDGRARREVLVARRGGRVYGYVNACPHVGTPLDWLPDRFMSADGRFLQCATHGARFAVEDGRCVAGPPKGRRLAPVALAVEDGVVVLAEELSP